MHKGQEWYQKIDAEKKIRGKAGPPCPQIFKPLDRAAPPDGFYNKKIYIDSLLTTLAQKDF